MSRLALLRARPGLGELPRELAKAWGGRTALVREDGTAVSFRELHRLSDLIACTLIARHDLRKGDRVVVPSEPASGVPALLGVVKAGGVAVPLPPGLDEEGAECHCRPRLRWDGSCEMLAEVPGGVFFPYTRKPDELAALAFREEEGIWRGTMLSDRALLSAGFPLVLALRALGLRSARLELPLDSPVGMAWALACLRAGAALSPSAMGGAWLGGIGVRGDLPGGAGAARFVCVAGMLERPAPSSASLCLDGPCFDEACGLVLVRLRRGGGDPPRLLWPLPHLRYRVDAGTRGLALGGAGLSWGYWGDMEGSMRMRPGGLFQTGLRVRRAGLVFRLG